MVGWPENLLYYPSLFLCSTLLQAGQTALLWGRAGQKNTDPMAGILFNGVRQVYQD